MSQNKAILMILTEDDVIFADKVEMENGEVFDIRSVKGVVPMDNAAAFRAVCQKKAQIEADMIAHASLQAQIRFARSLQENKSPGGIVIPK